MINSIKDYLPSLLLFCLMANSYSQEVAEVKFYNAFDQKVGIENTNLYQGVLYTKAFRTNSDKTQFFKNEDFLKGSVQYAGELYNGLDLKYDVHGDRILMKLVSNAGGGTLILFNEIVEGFKIGGSSFIKLEKEDALELEAYGFYEVSLVNPTFTLYTKYSKKSFKKKDRSSVYYEFTDAPSLYVLLYNNKYHMLKSKKDVKNLFPEIGKEIDKFYSIANRLRKSDPNGFHVALIKRIEILLSQTANKS